MTTNSPTIAMTGSDPPADAVNLLVLTSEWSDGIGACTPDLTAETRFLIITYARPAEHYVTYVREHAPAFPGKFVIIEAARDGTSASLEGVDIHVEQPDRLAGVGLRTNEILTRWRDEEEPVIVYFDSITSLLQYTDFKGTYQFLHAFTGQAHNIGACCYYNLVSAAHDESTIATLKQLFDTILQYDPEVESYQMHGRQG